MEVVISLFFMFKNACFTLFFGYVAGYVTAKKGKTDKKEHKKASTTCG